MSRSVGLTYEGERRCLVHSGNEMEHTCAGGPGEPLGYCSAWDGALVGSHTGRDGRSYGGQPTCDFTTPEEEPDV